MIKRDLMTLLILTLFMSKCTHENTYDFRRVHWGDNQILVINSESIKPSYVGVDSSIVVYDSIIVGKYLCKLAYYFEEKSLTSSRYIVQHYTNRQEGDGAAIITEMKELLNEKYGNPTNENASKDGVETTEWKSPKTEVFLNLEILNKSYINAETLITIGYDSVDALKKTENEEKKKKQENKNQTLESL